MKMSEYYSEPRINSVWGDEILAATVFEEWGQLENNDHSPATGCYKEVWTVEDFVIKRMKQGGELELEDEMKSYFYTIDQVGNEHVCPVLACFTTRDKYDDIHSWMVQPKLLGTMGELVRAMLRDDQEDFLINQAVQSGERLSTSPEFLVLPDLHGGNVMYDINYKWWIVDFAGHRPASGESWTLDHLNEIEYKEAA